ncbi:MAG: hypothetical protein JNL34_11540 [Anaerolineae bacterium]|nr:hypothetical protein [Anaerolineae bacterium]
MRKISLLIAVFVLLLAAAGVLALGPSPSWQLTQGAPASCSASSALVMPGVEINVAPGPASEQGVLSAPGNPNLGVTHDTSFSGVGTFGFTVFLTGPYSLPANTPLTLSVTTYHGPNYTGGVAYVSTATWDCTTGTLISLVSGVPAAPVTAAVCTTPLPSGSVVGDAPGGAQIYWGPSADKESNGVVLNPGSYWVVGFDETGEFAQVWLTCDTQLLWVRADAIGPSANAPWNGTPLPSRVVG